MNLNGFGIAKDEIKKSIVDALDKSGILYREFSRLKNETSVRKKILKDPQKYTTLTGKKIQDIIGIRIALYFPSDVNIAREIIGGLFNERLTDSSITEQDIKTFEPSRFNLVYDIPEPLHSILSNNNPANTEMTTQCGHFFIDSTFEIQLRTVLSEGWHEVEHDLRYKFPSDWDQLGLESRAFNGIYATLETAEWSMNKIIDQLAYHHYRESKIDALIRAIFKLRLDSSAQIKIELSQYLTHNKSILKKLLKIDREDFIIKRIGLKAPPPLNYNNIIYLANHLYIHDDHIDSITPDVIKQMISMN
ncbi:hypothetical protein [Aeromonas salmonicida]|uniref:hypothetical protein n=1 Tax=Aeromonas salmonicida TaxID=645 RepID=UPI0035A31088